MAPKPAWAKLTTRVPRYRSTSPRATMAYSEPAATPETVNCRKTFTGWSGHFPRLPVEAADLVGLGSVDLPHGELGIRPPDPAPLGVADGLGDPGVDVDLGHG